MTIPIKFSSSAAWLIIALLLGSCEKSISFTPENGSSSIVVEAVIESGVVTISNGSKTHKLREYKKEFGTGFNTFKYTIDTADLASSFNGEFGKSYSLRIDIDGKEYTAATTIPVLAKTLDTLWVKPAPASPDTNKVVLMTHTTDPPGFGNYIRYFTKTNDDAFFPGLNSVADDQVIDGKSYDIQVDRGVDRNTQIDFEEYPFFFKGDRVTVKLCNIDKATYDFFRTLEFSYSSIGNPFSSPTKVLGNISGGALGYFGGYAVQYITIQIPK